MMSDSDRLKGDAEYSKSFIAADERPADHVVSATVPEWSVVEQPEPKQLGVDVVLQGDAVVLRFSEKIDGVGLRAVEARQLAEKLRQRSHEADKVTKARKKR
jgi:hypothetical protein